MYPHTNSHNLLEEGSEHPAEMNKYFFVKDNIKNRVYTFELSPAINIAPFNHCIQLFTVLQDIHSYHSNNSE